MKDVSIESTSMPCRCPIRIRINRINSHVPGPKWTLTNQRIFSTPLGEIPAPVNPLKPPIPLCSILSLKLILVKPAHTLNGDGSPSTSHSFLTIRNTRIGFMPCSDISFLFSNGKAFSSIMTRIQN